MESEFLKEHAVAVFRGRPLPELAWPVGYARLVEKYELRVPLPRRLLAISSRHRKSATDDWQLLSSKTPASDTLASHLSLALKWEGVDLGVLAALSKVVDRDELVTFITDKPTGAYGRRAWFLYEWLTGERLPLDDLGKLKAVPALDPEAQYAISGGELSARHRVTNNLPGPPEFCPLVSRTEGLRTYDLEDLAQRTQEIIGRTHPDIIHRAGAFLLIKDSRASFAIEGERPQASRLERWAHAIGEAGKTDLTVEELLRLQRVLLGDPRFIRLGLRTEGGFVGFHDRETQRPIPDHIDARPGDLDVLVAGLVHFVNRALTGGIDPIVVAAAAAFGLVYIHPFEDGNGRIHRWLVHHVLAAGGLTPRELVFPVSHVIQRRISEYRAVLESFSRPLLPLIQWEETEDHNVRVLNETADFYSYFDATPHAAFLYACVQETIDVDLPREVGFLESFDRFASEVQDIVELPRRVVDLLVRFLEQGDGKLSGRALKKEFSALTEAEVEEVETLYEKTLKGSNDPRP